jgi:hypothetical protein
MFAWIVALCNIFFYEGINKNITFFNECFYRNKVILKIEIIMEIVY